MAADDIMTKSCSIIHNTSSRRLMPLWNIDHYVELAYRLMKACFHSKLQFSIVIIAAALSVESMMDGNWRHWTKHIKAD